MNGWEIFGIVVAALIVIAILFNLRDLIRYLKIRAM
jgi:hypothetical protein